MALPSPTALVGAVVLANVLSVGVLLLLYTNFELLRAYLRPILWALLWALALFPVKERWTHALRRAYTDGPFALLPWHPCATHQPEGPRAVAQRDTPCAKPTRVGSFWTGLWIATGGYVVLNSAVARTALGVFAFALCASPQCLQLTSRFCTHGLRDSTSRLVAAAAHFAAVSVAGGCAALPWHTLPRSLTGSYQSMCGYASVFSSCLVAVGHLTARILVLSLRAGTACACACVRVAATAIPVEDGVAAILTFGLLISVVAGAALLGIQVRWGGVFQCLACNVVHPPILQVALEWVDVALALR